MVRLNLFLILHGEEYEGHKSSRLDLPHMCTLHNPSRKVLQELTDKIDPALTKEGYLQAEASFRSLATAFGSVQYRRTMALMSEPFRRCTASAVMIATAGFEPQEWSVWGLTTPETVQAPSAIPIVVENGLVDANGDVRHMGGAQVVLQGGLLHCAAEFWNKGYKKDPIMGVIQEIKDDIQDHVKAWEQKTDQELHPVQKERQKKEKKKKDQNKEGEEEEHRFVADVQFLRYEKKGDPYSLTAASLQFNLTTNLQKPNKILDPHRQGMYHSVAPPLPESISQSSLDRAVLTARKAGCDTILMVVTQELVHELFDRMERDIGDEPLGPGSIVTVVAKTKKDGSLSYKPFGICPCGQFSVEALPPHAGPLEATKEPPEEWAQAMQEAGDGEMWGAFPPPPPERVGPSYARDIPPFSACLDLPDPSGHKWAWLHHGKINVK